MDYYNYYAKTYGRVFSIAEYKIKKTLNKGIDIREKYDSIYQTIRVSLNSYAGTRWNICESKGIDNLFHKFRKRSDELESNDKYIINEEYLNYFKNNRLGIKIRYKELIYELAIRKALFDIEDRVESLNETYSTIYGYNISNIELIKLPIADTEISQYKRQIENHLIQEYTNIKKHILIADVEFCMREFALYLRLRRDYNKSNEKYKTIYDRVMFEHNDPFNEVKIGRKYGDTIFYKYLKDEKPKESNNFNCKDSIDKIMMVCNTIKEEKFKAFILKIKDKKELCSDDQTFL